MSHMNLFLPFDVIIYFEEIILKKIWTKIFIGMPFLILAVWSSSGTLLERVILFKKKKEMQIPTKGEYPNM